MHVCKMLQFPINWTLTDVNANALMNERIRFSELILNDEWKLLCTWTPHLGYSKPRSIKIQRGSTVDEILVFGTLSISGSVTIGGRGRVESERKFSEFIRPGSTGGVEIRFNEEQEPLNFCSNGFYLRGIINIISIDDTSSDDFQNSECKKCVQEVLGNASLVKLSNDFKSLLDPGTSFFVDVNLTCGDASIPAHKNILSARSSVFAAMFKSPMRENRENEVVISDIDASVVRIMLTYIYTGKISNLTVSLASKLLFAADKYDLKDLKRVCCDFLKENISRKNVLIILNLGYMHAEDLKLCATDYICKKFTFSVIEASKEWKDLREDKPDRAIDILTYMVKARDEKLCRSPFTTPADIF